jgi:hypothetical protein
MTLSQGYAGKKQTLHKTTKMHIYTQGQTQTVQGLELESGQAYYSSDIFLILIRKIRHNLVYKA